MARRFSKKEVKWLEDAGFSITPEHPVYDFLKRTDTPHGTLCIGVCVSNKYERFGHYEIVVSLETGMDSIERTYSYVDETTEEAVERSLASFRAFGDAMVETAVTVMAELEMEQ